MKYISYFFIFILGLCNLNAMSSIREDSIAEYLDELNITPLMFAISQDDDITFELINRHDELNINLDEESQVGTALMIAVIRGNIRVVRELIKNKADLDIQDDTGETALIFAIQNKNEEIVKLLIESGADIRLKNIFGETAYNIAKKYNLSPEIIDMLK